MTPQYLLKLVREFESAVRNHDEMKRAMYPDDWDDIEREYEVCKKRLYNAIKQVEN